MNQSAKFSSPSLTRAFADAWRNRSRSGDDQLDKIQGQFLPAALEVQDAPPSPTGRWMLWILLSLFTIGILWAALGEVDIVVTAPGRIVPSGQVKIVQAPEAGSVSAIHVKEGQRVEKGAPLLSLDPTVANADDLRIREQLEDTSLQLQWREALETWLARGRPGALQPLSMPGGISNAEWGRVESLFEQQRTEITSRIESAEKEREANLAEQRSAQAELERTEATLAILKERVAAYQTLMENQYGAKIQYLEMLQQQTELERSIPVLRSRQEQLVKNAEALSASISATEGEIRNHNLLEISRLDSERNALQQESIKAKQRQQYQVLFAPVSGTVQELAIHTIGGVVTPAQALMKIVPEDATIEVEALLQNKDIGFVNEGQVAEIKVDTFNFTKYGLIDGAVKTISNDAVEDEQLGWVFKMKLDMDRDWIAVEEKQVGLSPGMAVTAEVKTGKRRLIEFFLSPLLRYKQESVRER